MDFLCPHQRSGIKNNYFLNKGHIQLQSIDYDPYWCFK